MKTITVEVTQADIANGKQGDCNFCPIALALNRHAPANHHFTVGTDRANLESVESIDSLITESVVMPRVAIEFVSSFDRIGFAEPFTFDITFARL